MPEKRYLASKSVGNAHWYAPAIELRMDIEREEGVEAGKRFIANVLNCTTPQQAYDYVMRRRKEHEAKYATTDR